MKNMIKDDLDIPKIFLGTGPFHEIGNYKFPELRTIYAVSNGIRMGYGIDCAVAYGNHRQIGRGIQASGKKREKVFLTSKLYNTQQDNHVKDHYDVICRELKVEYLDLLLQHWPQVSTYINAWKQMEELYFEKKIKYIGMANVEIPHLIEMENKCNILPRVIQIERNPFNIQEELVSFCKERGIYVQAYAPVGRMKNELIEQTVFKNLILKYKKTVPQIILRWHVQMGIIPVVRSIRRKRIAENMDIWDFELLDDEIKEISDLNRNYKIYDPRKYARYY